MVKIKIEIDPITKAKVNIGIDLPTIGQLTVEVDRSSIEALKERLLWCSLWKMNWKDLPGPRDWSPRVKGGKESLAAYWSSVPQHMLMSIEQVEKSGSDKIIEMVKAGMGFVVKIEKRLEVIYVSRKGQIEMSKSMRENFDALFGLGGE